MGVCAFFYSQNKLFCWYTYVCCVFELRVNMMNRKMSLLVLTFAPVLFCLPAKSQAASKDECAILLCMPQGFPSGCSAAKKAMQKRLRKGKSPAPALSSCTIESNDQKTSSNNSFPNVGRYVASLTGNQQCLTGANGVSSIGCSKRNAT